MSYQQEYVQRASNLRNTYVDCQYTNDSDSDDNISHNLYSSFLLLLLRRRKVNIADIEDNASLFNLSGSSVRVDQPLVVYLRDVFSVAVFSSLRYIYYRTCS